ncbi:MAG: EAL domain-containing protein [Butyrivibrio sp.]|nr:EAL domain-containing protein [Butyrivibrio sp.]
MERLKAINQKILKILFFKIIRDAFLNLSPVFITGGLIIMLINLPFDAYQTFITTFAGGVLYDILAALNNVSFGMASVYLVITVGYSYCFNKNCMEDLIPTILAGQCTFFVITDVFGKEGNMDALGVKGVFVAVVGGYLSAQFLHVLLRYRKDRYRNGMMMADLSFYKALSYIPFIVAVVVTIIILNTFICDITNKSNLYDLEVDTITRLFSVGGNSFVTAFFMAIANSLLWFFGVHGSNMIEPAMATIFTPLIDENIMAVSNGLPAPNIFCKEFFDLFILMGGTGTSFSLLFAILFFSKKKSTRDIAKVGFFPMIFNINEIMLFGIPLILNPYLFIPFLFVPVMALIVSYFAISTGLVPLITSQVSWTTPIFLSGYIGTGSIRGSILQLIVLIIGIFMYKPFLKMYEESSVDETVLLYNKLVDLMKKSEDDVKHINLTLRTDEIGIFARGFQNEIKEAIAKNKFEIHYQPQFDADGICVGAEALFRWKHPDLGIIYPPLIFQLAEESGINVSLESTILADTINDARDIRRETGFNKKISVNVSGSVIQTEKYVKALEEHVRNKDFKEGEICLEITEQKALLSKESAYVSLDDIRNMGYLMAIDDFSMGHTSLKYLMVHHFDIVKMDGSLIKGLVSESKERVSELVKSIVDMSNQMGFDVVAEYVETSEQQEILQSLGCNIYQGWLYSKAIPKDQFIELLIEQNNK